MATLTRQTMYRTKTILPIVLATLLAGFVSADEPVSFRKDLAPILLDQCLACHGPKKAEGGLWEGTPSSHRSRR